MAIESFSGKYRFLSNFYPALVTLDGVVYPSVEHAYQAAKTSEPGIRSFIRTANTPGKAKRLGGTVTLRKGWEDIKRDVMADLVGQKFQHPELMEKLLETGDEEIIEGNNWGDSFWGVCNGEGQNVLGYILMEIREDLRCL